MGLTKTFLGSNVTGDTTAVGTFSVTVNSTGYTHLVCFAKHEGTPTTITGSDNKGSGSFNALTKVDHTNNDLSGRLLWVKIGTPGAGHTVTVTYGANKTFSRLAVWGVNADSGLLDLHTESTNQGNGTAIDAGSLVTTVPSISFMGVGEYTALTYTPGSGWTEDLDSAILGQSRSDASGTLNPDASCTSAMDWVACSASFYEIQAGYIVGWLTA